MHPQPRFYLVFLILFFLLFPIPGYSQESDSADFTTIRLTTGLQGSYNDVTGPGRASSSLTDGFNHMEDLHVDLRGQKGEFKYQFSASGRATDDDRVDTHSTSLTSFQGRMEYRNNYFSMGDIFESFSQYSLSSSLKGLSYRYENQENAKPTLALVYGKSYPRWESWWKARDADAVDRSAYGFNVKHEVLSDLTLGLSFLRTEDTDRVDLFDPLYENNVFSLTADYKPLPGLTIAAEGAFSKTEETPAAGERTRSYDGTAFKIEAIGNEDPSRVVLTYERVDPDFETLMGSAVKDRERAGMRWRYKYTKDVTFNTNFAWYRNNLDNTSLSTHTYRPEFGVSIKRLFDRRYSNFDVTVKWDYKDRKRANDNSDYFVDFGYRDRFGIFDFDAGFGFTSYNVEHNETDTMDYTARLNISTRKSFEKVILRPFVNLSSSYIDDDVNDGTDKLYDYSLGLGMDFPDHNINSSFQFGQNILRSELGEHAEAYFINASAYYRPEFMKDSVFFARLAINDFAFQTGSRDYKEKSVVLGVSFPLEFNL